MMGEGGGIAAATSLLTAGAWDEVSLCSLKMMNLALKRVRMESWRRREGLGLIAPQAGLHRANRRRSGFSDDGDVFKCFCLCTRGNKILNF
jgi:hypothetical protein